MSITVIIARGDTGAPTTREVYAEGAKFNVENGELSIISARPQLVALYGSGNWLSVHVDDHVQVISEKPDDDSGDLDFGGFGDSDSDSDSDTSAEDSASDDASSADASSDDASSDDASSDDAS